MAFVINNFTGAELGSTDDALDTSGVSVTTSNKRTGTYSYLIGNAAAYSEFPCFPSVSGAADAGYGYVFGGAFRFSTITPASDRFFFEVYDSLSATVIKLGLDTSGNLVVTDSTATKSTISSSPGISTNTWYYCKLYFTATACEVFIDGVSKGTLTSKDYDTGSAVTAFIIEATDGATCYFDDLYFGSGATSSADGPADAEVFSYRSTISSVTPDTGNDLDLGTWALVQEVPWDLTSGHRAAYSGSGVQTGSVLTNDAGGSAGTGGPNTDANIDGTLLACKGGWVLTRTNGSTTTHYVLLGNNTDGAASFEVTLDTTAAYFAVISNSSTVLPTSSEYGKIGFAKGSGGRGIRCDEMLFEVLHQPPAAAKGAYPFQRPLRNFQHLLVR